MSPRSRQPIPRSEQGAAMLAALCLAMVFAISLSSYLALCYTSLTLSTRSVAISHSTELAETGVEQALYAFNNNDWNNWTLSGSTASATMTMTSAGLVLSSTNPTPLNYGNGMTGQVTITVTNYTTAPSVSSQATFTLPSYAGNTTASTTKGTVTYSAPTSPATAGSAPVFVNAVAATTGKIKFSSAGTVDSYNSNPSSGTYQTYVSATPGYSAVVLSQENNTSSATVRLGNVVVNGYAVGYNSTYPSTTNWLSYSASGKIVGPLTASGTYIDSSRLVTSPVPYQPVVVENLPGTWSSLPTTASSDGITLNETCVLGNTAASAPTVYSAGGGIILTSGQIVTIRGPVVIISYGGITISGGAQIQLATPQASLEVFDEYGTISIAGGGILNTNPIPLPKKLAIMDTTDTWDTAAITTNTPYYGVVYLPYMPITVGSRDATIYGSLVGLSVTFTYSPTFHYDIALRSPMSSYTSVTPLQSGAAFDYLNVPAAFGTMASSVP